MTQPSTQNQEVLYHLIKHRSLTSIELRQLTSSSYPAARLHNLKDYGISINHTTEPYTNKYQKKTHISRYTLLNTIQEAKKIYKQLTALIHS